MLFLVRQFRRFFVESRQIPLTFRERRFTSVQYPAFDLRLPCLFDRVVMLGRIVSSLQFGHDKMEDEPPRFVGQGCELGPEILGEDCDDGVTERLEVSGIQSFEAEVLPAEVVQEWTEHLLVIIDVVHNRSHSLHEAGCVTDEVRILHQRIALQVAARKKTLHFRCVLEYQEKNSNSSSGEIARQDLPVFKYRVLVLNR